MPKRRFLGFNTPSSFFVVDAARVIYIEPNRTTSGGSVCISTDGGDPIVRSFSDTDDALRTILELWQKDD